MVFFLQMEGGRGKEKSITFFKVSAYFLLQNSFFSPISFFSSCFFHLLGEIAGRLGLAESLLDLLVDKPDEGLVLLRQLLVQDLVVLLADLVSALLKRFSHGYTSVLDMNTAQDGAKIWDKIHHEGKCVKLFMEQFWGQN